MYSLMYVIHHMFCSIENKLKGSEKSAMSLMNRITLNYVLNGYNATLSHEIRYHF